MDAAAAIAVVELPMTAHDRRRVRRIVEAPDGARARAGAGDRHRAPSRARCCTTTRHAAYVVAAAPRTSWSCGRGTSRRRRGSATSSATCIATSRRAASEIVALADAALADRLRRAGVPFDRDRRAVPRPRPRRARALNAPTIGARCGCCSCSTRSFRSAPSRIPAASRPTPRWAASLPELRECCTRRSLSDGDAAELAAACLAWRRRSGPAMRVAADRAARARRA